MSALRSATKRMLKKALLRTGTLRLAQRLAAPSAVILMYHSIVEDPERTRNTIGVSQSGQDFEAHIRTLTERFAPVTLEQVTEFVNAGRPLPPGAVAVTFDDGFADNYECALPIMKRYGVSAAFYIMVNAVETGTSPWYCRLNFAFKTTTKPKWTDPEQGQTYKIETGRERKAALGRAWEIGASKVGGWQNEFVMLVERSLEVEPPGARVMMTWDQVRALRRAGHLIGAHTLSHPNLAHVTREEARAEIEGSKNRIEEEIGEPVEHFSYPHPALNPQWSPQTLQITRETGFKSAVLTTCGPVRKGDEPLALKRIYAANDLDQFVWNLDCTFLGRKV
jgi:peptidoglycan/xylan/chitin deacetylase (PgdA/CDA1 family)